MTLKKWLTCALTATTLAGTSFSATAETQVVVSIKPLELLVRAVAPEGTEVTTLVPSGSSPHTYTMRPSERRALASADVVFWVGPELENFLTRLLEGEELRDRTVALGGMQEDIQPEDGHYKAHDDHGHGHEHHGADPHIWLDPVLAADMAADIRNALANLPDSDRKALDAQLENFQTALRDAEKVIRDKLKPLEGISLFTYHDAFTRYAEHYGLDVAGVLTLNPEVSPGARHMAKVKQQLENANLPCLLTEPQFQRQWWQSITGKSEVKLATWDPLAGDISASETGYIEFQHAIADNVLGCLRD